MKTLRRLFKLLVIVTWFGGWALACSALYFVRTSDTGSRPNVAIIPKAHLGFAHTFSDTRNWTLADAHQHRDVVNQLIKSGKASELSHVGTVEQLTATDIALPTVPVVIDTWNNPMPPSQPTAPTLPAAKPADTPPVTGEHHSIFE